MVIDSDVLKIIEAGNVADNIFFLPPQQLERKTYERVNKVLDALGGKWNRRAKGHVFGDVSLEDAISDVLLTGSVIAKKTAFQFFETPEALAADLVTTADVRPEHRCLEPSAGRGRIAREIVAAGAKVECVELEPGNIKHLEEAGFNVYPGNFLAYDGGPYDRIVMNPPFTRQQDVAHVLHALTMLSNSGVLVSVMAAGVNFRMDRRTKDFWQVVNQKNHSIEELPAGTFKESGTMVSTVVLKVW